MIVRDPWRAGFSLGIAVLCIFAAACNPSGRPQQGQEENAANATDFPTLYATNCAGCHGDGGKQGPGRILNDPLYLAFIPRDDLKKTLVYGRPGTSMPAWAASQGGPLTDHQIDVLVDGMYKHWGKPFNTRGSALPAYVGAANGDPANGKKLFARSCFMCHGPGAKIGLVTSPSYLSLVSDQMLRTSIVVGRPDLGMPNYMLLKAGKPLTDADVSDLVGYLVSLRPAETPEDSRTTNYSRPAPSSGVGNKFGNSSQSGGTIEKQKDKK
jgi:cytochrome c oxidase cbb3-type subunit 3